MNRKAADELGENLYNVSKSSTTLYRTRCWSISNLWLFNCTGNSVADRPLRTKEYLAVSEKVPTQRFPHLGRSNSVFYLLIYLSAEFRLCSFLLEVSLTRLFLKLLGPAILPFTQWRMSCNCMFSYGQDETQSPMPMHLWLFISPFLINSPGRLVSPTGQALAQSMVGQWTQVSVLFTFSLKKANRLSRWFKFHLWNQTLLMHP